MRVSCSAFYWLAGAVDSEENATFLMLVSGGIDIVGLFLFTGAAHDAE